MSAPDRLDSPSAGAVTVAAAADQGYFPGLLVALGSLALACAPAADLEIHILDGGLTERSWERLARRIRRLHPRTRLERHPLAQTAIHRIRDNGGKGPMTYARLLVPDLVSGPRVIYLDSDCLVPGDISPLASLPLEGAPCGAVRDPITPVLGDDCPWTPALPRWESLPYFNAGLLVIDVARWKQARVTERALELLERDGARCRYWDQTALNFLLAGNWREIDPAWNEPCGRFQLGRTRPPSVIHFLCREKPWQGDTGGDTHALWRAAARDICGVKAGEFGWGALRDRIKLRLVEGLASGLALWFAAKKTLAQWRRQPTAAAAAGWAQAHWTGRRVARQARRRERGLRRRALRQIRETWRGRVRRS